MARRQESAPAGFLWHRALRGGWFPTFNRQTRTFRWRKK